MTDPSDTFFDADAAYSGSDGSSVGGHPDRASEYARLGGSSEGDHPGGDASQGCHVLVCKGCKFGCVLRVSLDACGNLVDVKGYTCERGLEYAKRKVASGSLDAVSVAAENPSCASGSEAVHGPALDDAATLEQPSVGYREFRRRHQRKRKQEHAEKAQ